MRNLPNIEPSATRAGEYVGYRDGAVFRIGKGRVRGHLWWAAEVTPAPGTEPRRSYIFAEALKALSDKLAGPEGGLHV